ncbi:MAG: hypothetical protein WBZ29_06400 [Methanocella sp.]
MQELDQKPAEMPGIDYRNKYVVLAIVLVGVMMSVLDGFMVNIALPAIMIVAAGVCVVAAALSALRNI